MLRHLLGRERDGVAELFQSPDMVAFDADGLQLIKVIWTQIRIWFLGA